MNTPAQTPPSPAVRSRWIEWVVAFAIPIAFYYATACRTISHGDSALNVEAIERLTISTHVNNHNLSILVGWLLSYLPVGSMAFRSVLQAVFFGGLTVGAFYLLVLREHGSRATAVIAALALMVSHSLWWHATVVETATANAFLMVLAIACVAGWRRTGTAAPILGLVAIAGVGIWQHRQLGMIGLGAGVLAIAHARRLWSAHDGRGVARFAAALAAAALLALVPYAATLVLRDARVAGSISAAFHAAAGGQFQKFMFKGSTLYGLRDEIYLVAFQFPSPFLLLIIPGVMLFFRRWGWGPAAAALLVIAAGNAAFFIYFNTWDRFEFLLITFVALAFWASFSIPPILEWIADRPLAWKTAFAALLVATFFAPPWFYAQLARWGRDPRSVWHGRYNNDYSVNTHDTAELIANPNKRGFRDIEDYIDVLFERLPQGATYFDDDSRAYFQVEYVRREEKTRRDLSVVMLNSWGITNWGFDQSGFSARLEQAYLTNHDLFLVTTNRPFAEYLEKTPRRYRFEPFTLTPTRWIYRLVTSAADSAGAADSAAWFRPVARRTITGLDLNSLDSKIRSEFRPKDRIMVRFEFSTNPLPFPLRFRWFGPDGQVAFETAPFVVAAGNTDVWSFLEHDGAVEAGAWRVEALSQEAVVGSASFRVEPR